jgi:predicted dehydrogenase
MSDLGVAVVGLGFMGATHLKAWKLVSGARIVAICNASGRRLDGDFSDAGGNLGDEEPLRLDMSSIKGYRDFSELLADPEVTVVDICTPTHTHKELAIAALRAGKHVVCEKPMARTAADAREMEAVAVETGRILMPAMCLRFWPEWAWLKEAAVSGRYGRVQSARFTRIAEAPSWGKDFFFNSELSGGALLDLHIHDADFVRYLFGEPTEVTARGYTRVSGGIDHVMVSYDFDPRNGPWVQAEGSWAMAPGFGFRMAYLVNFEKATADYDSSRTGACLQVSTEGKKDMVELDCPSGHQAMLQHFVDCVGVGVCPVVIPNGEGSRSVELVQREERDILQAQNSGTPG